MKVKNMMKLLEQMNPEAIVRLHPQNGEEALFLLTSADDKNSVWIESESDLDMGEELGQAFDYAISEGIDELDFYRGLLETDITVEMVRKYLGNDEADSMAKFCEEHGLL